MMKENKTSFGSGDPKLPNAITGPIIPDRDKSPRMTYSASNSRSSEQSSPPGRGRSPDLPKKIKRNPKFSEGYHFITLVVNQRIPIFKFNSLSILAMRALDFYAKRGDYELHGFVIMPDHIHFICDPRKLISEVIRDIKKYISKKTVEYLSDVNNNLLNKFKLKEQRKRKHIYQIWQRDFYDFNIITEKKFHEKLKYMYENPLRKGLCKQMEEYEFSDVSRYFGSGDPKLPT